LKDQNIQIFKNVSIINLKMIYFSCWCDLKVFFHRFQFQMITMKSSNTICKGNSLFFVAQKLCRERPPKGTFARLWSSEQVMLYFEFAKNGDTFYLIFKLFRIHDNQRRACSCHPFSSPSGFPISQRLSKVHLCVSNSWAHRDGLLFINVDQ